MSITKGKHTAARQVGRDRHNSRKTVVVPVTESIGPINVLLSPHTDSAEVEVTNIDSSNKQSTANPIEPKISDKLVCSKKARKHYSTDAMKHALDDVRNGMSVYKAAMEWSVPRTTLNDLTLNHYKVDSRPGPSPVLTSSEESLLVEWITEMGRRALPIQKDQLIDKILDVLNEEPRPNPFPDNRPGHTWYDRFIKRHPEISLRQAESICRARG